MTPKTDANPLDVTFDQFREKWLSDFKKGDMSSLEKGRQFALKLVSEWLEVDADDDDLLTLDGSGDGGIDIAHLQRSQINDDDSQDGDVWRLIQSKYGTAFQGRDTIFKEGQKVIQTLTRGKAGLSDSSRQFLQKLNNFRKQASPERDRIILVFATVLPLSEDERQALEDIRVLGRERIGSLFDVEDVSIDTIWKNLHPESNPTSFTVKGNFVGPADNNSDLLVGVIPLTDLYQFMEEYRKNTHSLDRLYEKNVRQFLGDKGPINKRIKLTLKNTPELFSLYNNGITVVVSDFKINSLNNSCELTNPYVVNGCQTTKTIWNVMDAQLNAGGTGKPSPELSEWRGRLKRGMVVTKIVKASDQANIENITRYTNSQTAIRGQDLLALNPFFENWHEQMDQRYNIFLEIQRGGWNSQCAFQDKHPDLKQYTEHAYAFDLIKVYGAGWLSQPGTAYQGSKAFLPGASLFKEITESEPIDADDLHAAYHLQQQAKKYKFGKGKNVKPSHKLSKFFYYFVTIDLLRAILKHKGHPDTPHNITKAFNTLVKSNQQALETLLNAADLVVDEYLSEESETSAYKEPSYEDNPNIWLKSAFLGKDRQKTPELDKLLAMHKSLIGRGYGGHPSPRDMISEALTTAFGQPA